MSAFETEAGPISGELSPLRTRRLWSLWEIMTPFPTPIILPILHVTGRYYPNFAGPLGNVPGKWRAPRKIAADDRAAFTSIYQTVAKACRQLQLAASLATVEKMLRCLANPKGTYGEFFGFGTELRERLEDEIQQRYLFALTLTEAEYFSEPRKGWEQVIDRFPECAGDVEESRKCFALARYAAAVFHSVQIVETGLIDLGKAIGVTDPLSGWTATTKALKKIIDAKHQDRTPFQQKHFSFLEQIHGTIEGLKNAWRNKVSHAQGKLTLLTSDFSPNVAEEIIFATRAFMRRLATDCPLPEGQPS